MLKMIVFLGNPGTQYRQTRHNVGQRVCGALEKKGAITGSWQSKFHALYEKQGDIVFLKPQTFMNESGISIQEASKFYGIAPEDILVVHDDIELPFGKVVLQLGGGMAGHNGLKSAKQHLGTERFQRLRIGVGRPQDKTQVAYFVLGRFSPLEEKMLEDVLNEAVETVLRYMVK